MILIGLTASLRQNADGAASCLEQNRDYFEAVLRAGALPVLLPLTRDEAVLRQALEKVDGVLFTGGVDVHPKRYGAEITWSVGMNEERDETEFTLLKMATEMKKPYLAICRGVQVMNTALGGTLYQDIEKEVPGSLLHPRHDRPREAVHEVTVSENTLLREILGTEKTGVNSRHHQAVKTPAAGAVVCGRSEDGIIEAIELPRSLHPFALGVQWHPESMAESVPRMQRIFDAFAAAAAGAGEIQKQEE